MVCRLRVPVRLRVRSASGCRSASGRWSVRATRARARGRRSVSRELGPGCALGPADVRTWKLKPLAHFPYEVAVEKWVWPDGSELIELLINVPLGEAAEAERAFRALLASRRIEPHRNQRAKARRALEFLTPPWEPCRSTLSVLSTVPADGCAVPPR